jgi:glycosyltransferase involved in cell wall biosynthesis
MVQVPTPFQPRVAVLLPCYNEEVAVAAVVRQFREALPWAQVYVYDNNSTDATVQRAREAGAEVCREDRQGKGHVVRRMFSDIEADIYVLADGDATYHAPSAVAMIDLLQQENLDMVVGVRVHESSAAYRAGHQFGNAMLTGVVAQLFGKSFNDILSGYRVFSRRFVKSFPALSRGFEIETELTVHALQLALPVSEVKTPYGARPEGSSSKLSTYRDGWRILRVILGLYRHEQPMACFGVLALLLALVSVGLGTPVVIEFFETGLVLRLPTAVLATGIMLIAALLVAVGLILETVTRGRREMRRLVYLQIPAPPAASGAPQNAGLPVRQVKAAVSEKRLP